MDWRKSILNGEDKMKLSILIPSLPESQHYLNRLMSILNPQIVEGVELIINNAPRSVPTGTKRNQMISDCSGEYFSQIDVDDIPSGFYVSEMLKAIEQGPDVITFNGFMTTDGINRRDFTIKLGENYEERNGKYYRYPNHLCGFKKAVVGHIKFRPIWVQEDYFYATELRDKNILKTAVHIEKEMYHYDFIDKNKKVNTVQSRRTRLR